MNTRSTAFGLAALLSLAAPAAAQPEHGSHRGGGGGEHDIGNVIRDFARIPTGDPAETLERGQRVVRRHASGGMHREQIRRALGNPETVTRPATEELRRHARRVAWLRRIRELAAGAGRDDLAERARRLLQLEGTRHRSRLGTLVGREMPADMDRVEPRREPGHR